MNVLSTTAHPTPEKEKRLGVKFTDLDTLLSESKPETEHMISAPQLAMMMPNAILIKRPGAR